MPVFSLEILAVRRGLLWIRNSMHIWPFSPGYFPTKHHPLGTGLFFSFPSFHCSKWCICGQIAGSRQSFPMRNQHKGEAWHHPPLQTMNLIQIRLVLAISKGKTNGRDNCLFNVRSSSVVPRFLTFTSHFIVHGGFQACYNQEAVRQYRSHF